MRRRRRLALVALVAVLVWAWVGFVLWRSLREDQARPAREVLQSSGDRWRSALRQRPAMARTTYAAVLAGRSAQAWSELLISAGVPAPAVVSALPPGETAETRGLRLIVGPHLDAAMAEALALPGRAVVRVEHGGAALTDGTARLSNVLVPLAGQPGLVLVPGRDERPVLVSEQGAVLGTIRPAGRGTVLRLGVDLAAWFIRLRQGDPARAGHDTDGNGALQPADLLPPADLAGPARPYADLAVDALLEALDHQLPCPLPRTRGLPAGARAVVVLTADQDYAPDQRLLQMSARLTRQHAHATFLLTDPGVGEVPDLNAVSGHAPRATPTTCAALLAAGHGLGIHPFPHTVEDVGVLATRFRLLTGVVPLSARNHHLRWSGFVDVPRAEADAGVALNLDTMAVCDGRAPCVSFPGGSARPLRFLEGERALPILQQPTAVDDYSLRPPGLAGLHPAARALGERARQALQQAQSAGVPLVVNAHPVFAVLAPEWLEPLLTAPGVRVLSAEEWLDFIARRRLARITSDVSCGAPRAELPPGVALR